MVLVVQVRSSVMCTPRNLVLLTLSTVDGQWGGQWSPPPEVQHNLLCLLHIEGQIISTTPFSQLCHFLSVVCFIFVANETYHCCVISELDVVGAELGSAVMGQQCEEQRLSTQPCGATVLSVVVLEVLWPTRLTEVFRLKSPGSYYRGNLVYLWAVVGLLCMNAELKSMNSILT